MDDLTNGRLRLSISNIAWPSDEDDEALDLVAKLGFGGVELAPSKVFGDLDAVSLETVRVYRRRLEDKGLVAPALQGILFGVQGAHLFESAVSRNRLAAHLRRVAEIASAVGAKACVFGAPALRDPGSLSMKEAFRIAEAFLQEIALDYAAQNVELCFEPVPSSYQCRFVTQTQEAFDLVERVNSPGVAVQLDTGTIFTNGEDPTIIERAVKRIGHFHVSEPGLVPIGTSGAVHASVAEALKRSLYSHWISIEMRAAEDWRRAIRQAHALVCSIYLNTHDAP